MVHQYIWRVDLLLKKSGLVLLNGLLVLHHHRGVTITLIVTLEVERSQQPEGVLRNILVVPPSILSAMDEVTNLGRTFLTRSTW